jgi:hypothetical protein
VDDLEDFRKADNKLSEETETFAETANIDHRIIANL